MPIEPGEDTTSPPGLPIVPPDNYTGWRQPPGSRGNDEKAQPAFLTGGHDHGAGF